MVVPLAWRFEPLFENVSLMFEMDFHCTGPVPPLQVNWTLNPLEMAVTLGAEHFCWRLSACQGWPAFFAQTLMSRCTGLPMEGVTVELICHSPG